MKKVLLCSLLFLFATLSVFAYSWHVENYDIDIQVGKNAVHKVSEKYTMVYEQPKHGFYRYIPVNFRDAMSAKVTDISCSDSWAKEEIDDGYLVLRIGSSSKEYKGVKDYVLSYTYDLGSDLNNGYDEFYFNLLGTDWDVPVNNAVFSVHVPMSYKDAKVWVTTGTYGKSVPVDFKIQENSDGFTVSGNLKNLREEQGITIRVQMPDNWYENTRQFWDFRSIFSVVSPLVSVVLLIFAALIWFLHGRDDVPIISAKFDPPQGFTPLMVGFIADGQVDDKDITSMLYYWADEGLITINEKKKNQFSFTKIFDIPEDAPDFEKKLFNGFFKAADSTDTVTLKALQESNFFDCVTKTKMRVSRYFTGERALNDKKTAGYQLLCLLFSIVSFGCFAMTVGLYEPMMDTAVAICVAGFFCTFFTLAFIRGLFRRFYVRKTNFLAVVLCVIPSLITGALLFAVSNNAVLTLITVVCAGLMTFFSAITSKRSQYGNKVLEDVLGYREFIDKVSMSQLTMLIDKNPEYYYHVLSYAIVLGLENTWAKKFESVATVKPNWYMGPSAGDVFFYSRMSARLNTAVRLNAMNTAARGMSSPGHVRSSFNFSGFSGGGFGGGGGRAW